MIARLRTTARSSVGSSSEPRARQVGAYPAEVFRLGKEMSEKLTRLVRHPRFNNDTTPRYDAAAAKLARERTIAFFREHVR